MLWARPDCKQVRHLAFTIFALTASILFFVNRRLAVGTALYAEGIGMGDLYPFRSKASSILPRADG